MSSPPYIPIQVIDLDSDNDGIVGLVDLEAYYKAHLSSKGDPNYDRQFDADFDADIDDDDRAIFVDTYYNNNNLETIRTAIKTANTQKLTWPDGWVAWLVALNYTHAIDFTGKDNYSPPGWISIHRHPYISSGESKYICWQFGMDTSNSAYKALGYGCLLYASSASHGFNIFWIGGTWTNLNNWYILEPQTGQVFCATTITDPDNIWYVKYIDFPEKTFPRAGFPEICEFPSHMIQRVVGTNTLQISDDPAYYKHQQSFPYTGLEEPIPSLFDRTLPDLPGVAPTVTTQVATDIEGNSAIGNGNITGVGTENCDQRGVEWGDTPGSYPNKAVDSGNFSAGAFTKPMTGLSPGNTYYYRAKAHNSAGWGYGSEQSFTTSISIIEKTSHDSGSGVDGKLDRALALAQIGSGLDLSHLVKTLLLSDTGQAVESTLLIITEASKKSSDSGSGVEAIIARALHAKEYPTGAIDLAKIAFKAITASDNGQGQETSWKVVSGRDMNLITYTKNYMDLKVYTEVR